MPLATPPEFRGNVTKLSVDLQSVDGREAFVLDFREAGFDVPERSLREHLNHLRRLGLAAHNGGSGRGSFWSLVHPDQAPRPEAGFDALPER